MHILVTGGAGFIGSYLVEYHLKKNDSVHVIDDFSTGGLSNLMAFQEYSGFSYTQADILTCNNLNQLVAKADLIYHMAAVVGVLRVIKETEHLLATNISGTERLLRAANISGKKPRILLASTSEVYGESHLSCSSETENLIIGQGKKSCSNYVVSKIALEYFGMAYYDHFELPITILRLFNTIGPRQVGHYGMVVPRFVDYALTHQPILVHGTGEQTRSFCDVRDTVAMMERIAHTPESVGQILNVGHDEEVSINHLAKLVKKLAHSDSEIKHISYDKVYGKDFKDVMTRRPDMSKLQQLIHYTYQWNLNDSIRDLIAHQTSKGLF